MSDANVLAGIDDYVIVKDMQGRRINHDLYKVIKVRKDSTCLLKRISERQALDGFESIDYTVSSDDADIEIVANLGRKIPKTNLTIFNVKMNALTEQFSVPDWGNVFWFIPSDNGQLREEVKNILVECTAELKDIGCLELFPFQTHIVERFDNQKLQGTYTKHRGVFDVIHFYVSKTEGMELSDIVVYHEYAHGLWHYCVSNVDKKNWYNYYINSCSAQYISEKQMLAVAKELASAESLKSYRSENKDDKAIMLAFKSLMKNAKSHHNLSPRDIDVILETGGDIYPLLVKNDSPPKSAMIDIDTKVTDYANKNTVEMFCESFAIYMVRKESELPEDIVTLLENTIQHLAPREMGIEK